MVESYPSPRVSKRLRFEVFRRDGFRCRYCGVTPDEAELTVDHAVPVTLGGSTKPENLATCCKSCNSGKASIAPDSPTVAALDADAFRWGRAMAQVIEMRQQELQGLLDKLEWFDELWDDWSWGDNQQEVPRDPSWRVSIERFIVAGLGANELDHFVRVAMGSKAGPKGAWKYFCGCCWTEIKLRQEIARQFVEGEVP